MKLRDKVTLILLMLWLVMVAIAYIGSHLILSKSYYELEHKQANDSLRRVHEAIQQMTTSVNTMTASWAIWDDTYRFVEDLNKTYMKINLVPSSFASSDVDVILYYNQNKKLVYKMAVNPERTAEAPVPQEFLDDMSPNGVFKYQPKIHEKIEGLIATSSGIYMMAAQPIVTSNNEGPVRGTLIMARFLSDAAIKKIKDVTDLDLSIYMLLNQNLTDEILFAKKKIIEENRDLIDMKDDKKIVGYGLLDDIDGHPIAIIKTSMPRQIYQFGARTVKYFNTVYLIYSFILITILWFMLQRLLVKRLEGLKNHIGSVDGNQYFNNILSGFSDEISSVTTLYHQATHDALTGLANRNLLEKVFSHHVERVNQKQSRIALLFLDIDFFKRINDTLGHEVGDLLLIEVAQRITSCLRENDLAVRMGGDEFVVMLVDIDVPQIESVIRRIYQMFSQVISINEHELSIASSMGISVYPGDGNTISTLLKNADIALYHAKESGRNHYQYYSGKLNQAIYEAHRKEIELQQAIENKELSLVYQPIFDVLTRRIVSFEALIRWMHPERGLITGEEIIPIAEKSGLIHPIGKWVLVNTCRQIKNWQEKGLPVVPVSVNISVMQARHTSLYRMVNEVLQHTGIDARYLELELMESSYIDITDTIYNDMQMLKTKGINLIVDDFGVGYSGLGYLRKLPVSKLKIDQSFIKDSCKNPDDCAITLAIIAIAHQLDLQVIAEGVESLQQYEFLRMNRVDAAQGNYLSPPLDAAECETLLAHQHTVTTSYEE